MILDNVVAAFKSATRETAYEFKIGKDYYVFTESDFKDRKDIYLAPDDYSNSEVYIDGQRRDYLDAKGVTRGVLITDDDENSEDTDTGVYFFSKPHELAAIKAAYKVPGNLRFNACGYSVVLRTNGTLSIGCQTHTLDEWEHDGSQIVRDYMGYGADDQIDTLRTLLPRMRKWVETGRK